MRARMNRLLPLFLLLSCSAVALPTPPRSKIAVTHVSVIDCTGGPVKADQTVVVSDGRITAVASASKVTIPSEARVLDGRGKFLIPGLWDMHVHVLWEPAVDTLIPLMVANGVTGCRDMHTHFPFERINGWVDEVQAGRRVGPRILFAGPIVDGPRPIWPGSIVVGDADAARRAVRELKKSGANFVKVYEGIPREAYFALADECKKQDMTFAGHVPGAITPAEASEAGQQSIEHLSHLLEH